MSDKFNFGDKAKDIVSGFTGIVTGRYSYINGCVRYELSPAGLQKDGSPIDGRVFDEGQLALVKAGVVKIPGKPTGGPMRTPALPATPSR